MWEEQRSLKPKHTHISPESGTEDNSVAFVSKSAFVGEGIPNRMTNQLNSV